MINIPEEYVVEKFFQYTYKPKYNKFNETYQACCPVCREGKSFGKKRRCFYIPKNNNIFCHNCGWNSSPWNWIKKVTGVSDMDIIQELKTFEKPENLGIVTKEPNVLKVSEELPDDVIDLFDQQQIQYYSDNSIVNQALEFIHKRKIHLAVNKPKSLYLSLKDPVHKNRIIIPFYNEKSKVDFYQSRGFLSDDKKPKYLSKINSDKTLFGLNQIDSSLNQVFVFEGPINAMFCINGIAVAGIQKGKQLFTVKQQTQFEQQLKWYERVWVLDSQWIDNTSLVKTQKLIEQGEKVFIWPEKIGKAFKDFNDLAIQYGVDQVSTEFVLKHVYDPLTSAIKIAEIKQFTANY